MTYAELRKYAATKLSKDRNCEGLLVARLFKGSNRKETGDTFPLFQYRKESPKAEVVAVSADGYAVGIAKVEEVLEFIDEEVSDGRADAHDETDLLYPSEILERTR